MAPLPKVMTSKPSVPEPVSKVSVNGIVAIGVCVAITLTLTLVLVACIHQRRKRNKKRRQELVESLRVGDNSSSEISIPPDPESAVGGEPEDIKELFYFYWRQGTRQVTNRQTCSVELKARIDERIEQERTGPRRQTFGGNPTNTIQSKDIHSNTEVLGAHHPLFPKRGGTRPLHYSKVLRTSNLQDGPNLSFDELEEIARQPDNQEAQNESTDCETSHVDIARRMGADTESEETLCSPYTEELSLGLPFLQVQNSGPDLDLTRYIIDTGEREQTRRLRRLNSCPEAGASKTRERTMSLSSLLLTWDGMKTSVVSSIELEDI